MHSLLAKVKKSDVITEPFPHIIIKDALDEELYTKLMSEFPFINTISKGIENKGLKISSNSTRLHYLAKEIFADDQPSCLWKDEIVKKYFYDEYISGRLKHEANLLFTMEEIKRLNFSPATAVE